jgi:hypothetical protein
VVVTDPESKIETDLVYPDDFSVSGVGQASGGRVALGAAPVPGLTVTIVRNIPLTQELDLVNNDPFDADTLEESLDKAWMAFQQMDETLSRCVKTPVGSTIHPDDLIEDLIGFKASAQAAATAAQAAQGSAEAARSSAQAAQSLAEAAAASAWSAAQSLGSATTSGEGLVELATMEEARAGTDTERAVTPAGLNAATNSEPYTAAASSGGALTLNLDTARVFAVTLTENVTAFNVVNAVGGRASAFTLILTQASETKTLAWPGGTQWPSGLAPTIASSGAKYIFTFFSVDGGSTWHGFIAGSEVA